MERAARLREERKSKLLKQTGEAAIAGGSKGFENDEMPYRPNYSQEPSTGYYGASNMRPHSQEDIKDARNSLRLLKAKMKERQ